MKSTEDTELANIDELPTGLTAAQLDALDLAVRESQGRAIAAIDAAIEGQSIDALTTTTDAPIDSDLEIRRQRESRERYVPDATSESYDGPTDEYGAPLSECLRAWNKARAAQVWAVLERELPAALAVPAPSKPIVLQPDVADYLGIRADDVLIQTDEGRAVFFRAIEAGQTIAPETECQFELTFVDEERESYVGPMPGAEAWKEIEATCAKRGAAFRVVAVAVAFIERAASRH